MIDYMQKGGPLMWLLVILSIVATIIFLERLIYYHRVTLRVGEFLRGLSILISSYRFGEALHECAGTAGPVARVLHAAIARYEAPRAELKEIVREAGQLEVPKLEERLGVLTCIALVAPAVGLLGTVMGMIEAFDALSGNVGGGATVADISAGLYKSLLTTAAGLVVAIPTSVAYSFLSSRVNNLMHDMERAGIEIVNLITQYAHQPKSVLLHEELAVKRAARAEEVAALEAVAHHPPLQGKSSHPIPVNFDNPANFDLPMPAAVNAPANSPKAEDKGTRKKAGSAVKVGHTHQREPQLGDNA